jgi:hypothetical protein
VGTRGDRWERLLAKPMLVASVLVIPAIDLDAGDYGSSWSPDSAVGVLWLRVVDCACCERRRLCADSDPGRRVVGHFETAGAWLPLAGPPSTLHGKGDQKYHYSNDTDHVRHPGKRTGHVARVRPYEADNRPDDEQSDHRG